jgi:hypothetical protein
LFSRVKEHLCGKRLNRKTISTLLSLPLSSIWARTNTELLLIVYHVDGKSVWTALVITLSRGHIYTHWGISIIFLSNILHTQNFWNGPRIYGNENSCCLQSFHRT